jgi:hypothetical protein
MAGGETRARRAQKQMDQGSVDKESSTLGARIQSSQGEVDCHQEVGEAGCSRDIHPSRGNESQA